MVVEWAGAVVVDDITVVVAVDEEEVDGVAVMVMVADTVDGVADVAMVVVMVMVDGEEEEEDGEEDGVDMVVDMDMDIQLVGGVVMVDMDGQWVDMVMD